MLLGSRLSPGKAWARWAVHMQEKVGGAEAAVTPLKHLLPLPAVQACCASLLPLLAQVARGPQLGKLASHCCF